MTEDTTILVADDDADILNIVASVLELSGYTVLRANDGAEANRILSQALPDVAVLDFTMPGFTGKELCQRIRQMPGGEFVSVMILTARDGIQDKVSLLEGGADDYVTKPFNHAELVARVRSLLRIRNLNLSLSEKNKELKKLQAKLLEKEREIAVTQVAGTTAHNMGQPISAIILNLHLIEQFPPDDERYKKALAAIRQDAKRLADLVESLKQADAGKMSEYFGKTQILELAEKKGPVSGK